MFPPHPFLHFLKCIDFWFLWLTIKHWLNNCYDCWSYRELWSRLSSTTVHSGFIVLHIESCQEYWWYSVIECLSFSFRRVIILFDLMVARVYYQEIQFFLQYYEVYNLSIYQFVFSFVQLIISLRLFWLGLHALCFSLLFKFLFPIADYLGHSLFLYFFFKCLSLHFV